VLRRLLHVAEDLLDAPPVFEEVLLEERDDLALEAPDHVLRRGDVHPVAVPEHEVEQRLDRDPRRSAPPGGRTRTRGNTAADGGPPPTQPPAEPGAASTE